MDNIMRELIEIENSANDYIKRAGEEKKKLPGRISTKTIDIEKKYDEEIKEELKEISARADSEAVKAMAEIRYDCAGKIARLEDEYSAKKYDWINEIFTKILSGSYDV